MEVATLLPSS